MVRRRPIYRAVASPENVRRALPKNSDFRPPKKTVHPYKVTITNISPYFKNNNCIFDFCIV